MSKQPHYPPRWADRMLEWLCSEEHLEILQGDLHELYEYRVEQKGKHLANLHYVKDAFDMLRPFALKKKRSPVKNNTFAMFKNYFKISFRNMLRHKVYAGINITGLSVGIACFMLIFLYVQDELSYDRYHEHADDIYRVVVNDYSGSGEVDRVFTYSPPMYAPTLRADYPQVLSSVRFYPWSFPIVKSEDKQFEESYFNFVEPGIFDVFSFEFLEGQAEGALDDPNSLMITESTARKYFGDESAFGKTLKVIDRGNATDFKVTAVVKDFPAQSHMSYDFMASWVTYENRSGTSALNDYYGNYNYPTYIRLAPGADIAALKAQMPAMLDKNIEDIQGFKASERVGLEFQKLTGIHLNESAGSGGTNNLYYIYLFGAIGVLVLVIACINYMNLATAKYVNRLKEVGVRKVMGARKGNISHQFLVESFFYAFVALLIGYGISLLMLPTVNRFASKTLSLNPADNAGLIIFVMGVAAFVALLAGSYPALFMSRFGVVTALKNGLAKGQGKSWFRTGLVVFQFAITIGLIIGVAVVDRQIHFIQTQDPGFDREHVVYFWASPSVNQRLDVFKSELLANPNITAASAASRIPTGRLGDALDASLFNEDREEVVDFRLPFLMVDPDYLDVYDIDLLAGNGFSEEAPADSSQLFVINETAVKKLGWNDPREAIGQRISYGWYSGFISGVVNDFHFESMHSAIQPMILLHDKRNKRMMSVRISGQNIPETMKFLETQFKAYNPDRTFNPSFVDKLFNDQYEGEQLLSEISKAFSLVAIVIACLGLLGLVGFTMEQRSKEISVRKVLGASILHILMLVNKRYVLLILLAFAIAVPLSYYFLSDWLGSFEYHINIGAGLILFSGLLAGIIAIATICAQALKVALANPVQYLRNE